MPPERSGPPDGVSVPARVQPGRGARPALQGAVSFCQKAADKKAERLVPKAILCPVCGVAAPPEAHGPRRRASTAGRSKPKSRGRFGVGSVMPGGLCPQPRPHLPWWPLCAAPPGAPGYDPAPLCPGVTSLCRGGVWRLHSHAAEAHCSSTRDGQRGPPGSGRAGCAARRGCSSVGTG